MTEKKKKKKAGGKGRTWSTYLDPYSSRDFGREIPISGEEGVTEGYSQEEVEENTWLCGMIKFKNQNDKKHEFVHGETNS